MKKVSRSYNFGDDLIELIQLDEHLWEVEHQASDETIDSAIFEHEEDAQKYFLLRVIGLECCFVGRPGMYREVDKSEFLAMLGQEGGSVFREQTDKEIIRLRKAN